MGWIWDHQGLAVRAVLQGPVGIREWNKVEGSCVAARAPPLGRDEVEHFVDVEDRIKQLGDDMARAVIGKRKAFGQHVLQQCAVD